MMRIQETTHDFTVFSAQRRHCRQNAILVILATPLTGCAGGNGGTAVVRTQDISLGSVVSRVVGTAQPPIAVSGSTCAVMGIAGASITAAKDANPSVGGIADTRILLTSLKTGNLEIYSVRPDGTDLKQLTNDSATDMDPTWLPDGNRIGFVSNRAGSFDIYVMNADGSSVTQVTHTAGATRHPTWSPDGKKIVYYDVYQRSLFMVNADGTSPRFIFSGAKQPAWSPDGRNLAWTNSSLFNDSPGIFVRRMDGDVADIFATASITKAGTLEESPAWSPDGKRLAVTRYAKNAKGLTIGWQIVTENRDGTGDKVIVSDAPTPDNTNNYSFAPSWSPDGKSIAFVSTIEGPAGDLNWHSNLLIVNLETGTMRHCASDLGFAEDPVVSWSPYPQRAPRTLIGTGGQLASSAAGLLIGQQGKVLTSAVSFDTNLADRSKAQIVVSPQESGATSLVFTATADGVPVTTLRYVNGDSKMTEVIGARGSVSTTAAGAIITFDGSRGIVTTVIPYNATKAAGNLAKPVHEGETLVFHGSFAGVWNEAGKNIAPEGASEIRLDGRTGRVCSVR